MCNNVAGLAQVERVRLSSVGQCDCSVALHSQTKAIRSVAAYRAYSVRVCTSLVLHTQGIVLNQVLAGVIVFIFNSITQLLKGKALRLEELLSVTTDQSLNI